MLHKAKSIINSEKYKKMLHNFSYLSLIQIFNKLLPILVVPYIVRTVGVEKFGVISFAWAIVSYFILITQYSFRITAVEYVSKQRKDKEKLSQYLWNIIAIKIIISFVLFIFFMIAVYSVNKMHQEMTVMLFTYLLVFADVLMPIFFFQGMEEMKYIAIFNIVAKLMYVVGIYLVVDREADYIYIPMLNGVTLLCVSIYALYYLHKKYNLHVLFPKYHEMITILHEGKDIFLSNMSVSFYTTINPIILGMMLGYKEVGIYSLAESMFGAATAIIKNFTMVSHPYLARFSSDLKLLAKNAKKFLSIYMVFLLFSSLMLFILSDFIITLLFGKGHEESIVILRILALAMMFEPLGGFFTFYLSLKSQRQKIRQITFKTMVVNLILIVPMIYIFGVKGVAYLFLVLALVMVYLNARENQEILFFYKDQ